jgi:hypothetical protein
MTSSLFPFPQTSPDDALRSGKDLQGLAEIARERTDRFRPRTVRARRVGEKLALDEVLSMLIHQGVLED